MTKRGVFQREKQLIKMLEDRPDMSKYIRKGDSLWKWTVRKFAGENLTDALDWNGELGRNDFIRQIANTEFRAIKKTSLFYKNVWKRWFILKGLSTIPFYWDIWHGNESISFKQWISGFGKNSDYPWKFYGYDYDMYVKPYIKKRTS